MGRTAADTDGGDEARRTPRKSTRKRKRTRPAAGPPFEETHAAHVYEKGERCLGRYKGGGAWYEATVTRVHAPEPNTSATHTYNIEYTQDETESGARKWRKRELKEREVCPERIEPWPANAGLSVGCRCKVRFQDKWYDATVKQEHYDSKHARTPCRYDIVYEPNDAHDPDEDWAYENGVGPENVVVDGGREEEEDDIEGDEQENEQMDEQGCAQNSQEDSYEYVLWNSADGYGDSDSGSDGDGDGDGGSDEDEAADADDDEPNHASNDSDAVTPRQHQVAAVPAELDQVAAAPGAVLQGDEPATAPQAAGQHGQAAAQPQRAARDGAAAHPVAGAGALAFQPQTPAAEQLPQIVSRLAHELDQRARRAEERADASGKQAREQADRITKRLRGRLRWRLDSPPPWRPSTTPRRPSTSRPRGGRQTAWRSWAASPPRRRRPRAAPRSRQRSAKHGKR